MLMLAVVDGSLDKEMQHGINTAKEVDPYLQRTIAVHTKMDKAIPSAWWATGALLHVFGGTCTTCLFMPVHMFEPQMDPCFPSQVHSCAAWLISNLS